MRGSAKGDEPPELRDWKAEQLRNGIEPEYRNLQQPEKGATEKSLSNEGTPPELLVQGFLDTDLDGARPSFANVAIGYLRE